MIFCLSTLGHFIAEYCPNPAGCRATITFPDGRDKINVQLTDLDFMVTINNTQDRPVWLVSSFQQWDDTSVIDIYSHITCYIILTFHSGLYPGDPLPAIQEGIH